MSNRGTESYIRISSLVIDFFVVVVVVCVIFKINDNGTPHQNVNQLYVREKQIEKDGEKADEKPGLPHDEKRNGRKLFLYLTQKNIFHYVFVKKKKKNRKE